MQPEDHNSSSPFYFSTPSGDDRNIPGSTASDTERHQTPGWSPATFGYQPQPSLDHNNWRNQGPSGIFPSHPGASEGYEGSTARFPSNISAERHTGLPRQPPFAPDDQRAASSALAHALESSDRVGPSVYAPKNSSSFNTTTRDPSPYLQPTNVEEEYILSRRPSYETRLPSLSTTRPATNPYPPESSTRQSITTSRRSSYTRDNQYPIIEHSLSGPEYTRRPYSESDYRLNHYSNQPSDPDRYLPEATPSIRRNSLREDYLPPFSASSTSSSSSYDRSSPIIYESSTLHPLPLPPSSAHRPDVVNTGYPSTAPSRNVPSSSNTSYPSGLQDTASPQVNAQQNAPHPTLRHVCQICGKRFIRPSSLKVHETTHTGDKPFVCPEEGCRRSFSVLSNMRRHVRVQHQNHEDNR